MEIPMPRKMVFILKWDPEVILIVHDESIDAWIKVLPF